MNNRMRPIHPGEVLREEFLTPLAMSATALAALVHVPANRMTEIVAEKRSITAGTALRLAKCFATTPQFWLNLQQAYDLRKAEGEKEIVAVLRMIKPAPLAATKRAPKRRGGP